MEQCIAEIRSWLEWNCLKLNDGKTEMMIIGQSHNLKKLKDNRTITIGSSIVESSSSARNIGAVLDEELKMVKHVNSICRACYS